MFKVGMVGQYGKSYYIFYVYWITVTSIFWFVRMQSKLEKIINIAKKDIT